MRKRLANRLMRHGRYGLAAMATALLIATLASKPLPAWPQTLQDQPGQTITIRLSSFAFDPDRLSVPVGVPLRLHLVNESSGGHNFSAPALFAASTFPSGAPPQNGTIEVSAGSSVDVVLIPRVSGTYRFECTHFLHSLFGMTGRIVVTPS
jgi:plastocyanin